MGTGGALKNRLAEVVVSLDTERAEITPVFFAFCENVRNDCILRVCGPNCPTGCYSEQALYAERDRSSGLTGTSSPGWAIGSQVTYSNIGTGVAQGGGQMNMYRSLKASVRTPVHL